MPGAAHEPQVASELASHKHTTGITHHCAGVQVHMIIVNLLLNYVVCDKILAARPSPNYIIGARQLYTVHVLLI